MVRTGSGTPYFPAIHCTTAAQVHKAKGRFT